MRESTARPAGYRRRSRADRRNGRKTVEEPGKILDPPNANAEAGGVIRSRLYDRTCGFFITLFFSMVFVETIVEDISRAYIFIRSGSQEMNLQNLLGKYLSDPWQAAYGVMILLFIASGALVHYSRRSGFVLGKLMCAVCALLTLPEFLTILHGLVTGFPILFGEADSKLTAAYVSRLGIFVFYVLLIFAFFWLFARGKKEEILKLAAWGSVLLTPVWLRAAYGHVFPDHYGAAPDPVYLYTLLLYLPAAWFGWNAVAEYRKSPIH